MKLSTGTNINNKFKILSALGQGGMASVFKAVQTSLDRFVAIKFLTNTSLSAEAKVRIQREAVVLSRLSHPGLVQLYDYDEWQEIPFLYMEFIEGCPLRNELDESGPLDVQRALRLLMKICEVVAYLHSQSIVHRDLKPDNIMLTSENNVEVPKLIDLGYVRALPEAGLDWKTMTSAGFVVGTPNYMSPEQCLGEKVDVRSDLYSLGLILHQCLTAKVPFDFSNVSEIFSKQVSTDLQPLPRLHPASQVKGLQQVISRATAKDRQDRYQTAEEMLDDLKLVEAGKGGSIKAKRRHRSKTHDPPLVSRKFGLALTACAVVAGLSLVLINWVLHGESEPGHEAGSGTLPAKVEALKEDDVFASLDATDPQAAQIAESNLVKLFDTNLVYTSVDMTRRTLGRFKTLVKTPVGWRRLCDAIIKSHATVAQKTAFIERIMDNAPADSYVLLAESLLAADTKRHYWEQARLWARLAHLCYRHGDSAAAKTCLNQAVDRHYSHYWIMSRVSAGDNKARAELLNRFTVIAQDTAGEGEDSFRRRCDFVELQRMLVSDNGWQMYLSCLKEFSADANCKLAALVAAAQDAALPVSAEIERQADSVASSPNFDARFGALVDIYCFLALRYYEHKDYKNAMRLALKASRAEESMPGKKQYALRSIVRLCPIFEHARDYDWIIRHATPACEGGPPIDCYPFVMLMRVCVIRDMKKTFEGVLMDLVERIDEVRNAHYYDTSEIRGVNEFPPLLKMLNERGWNSTAIFIQSTLDDAHLNDCRQVKMQSQSPSEFLPNYGLYHGVSDE